MCLRTVEQSEDVLSQGLQALGRLELLDGSMLLDKQCMKVTSR